MRGLIKCQFCGKETTVPDNMTGTLLRCPYCIRDFDICDPASSPDADNPNDTPAPDFQGNPALQSAVNAIITNRQKSLRTQNLLLMITTLIAAPAAWVIHSKEDLITLAIFIAISLVIGGLALTFANSRFSTITRTVLRNMSAEPSMQTLTHQQLYQCLLAALAAKLNIDEAELVSDPLLRQALQQLEDLPATPQRCR